ncbi:hypothetical protein LCGC14_1192480 [marine sediment metagenome]|uniref:DUF4434 domain-containing protein n=1 Tax=marine sediment metagenome TaxID=412755 RepID=A0A0F9PPA9_9ZZZZ
MKQYVYLFPILLLLTSGCNNRTLSQTEINRVNKQWSRSSNIGIRFSGTFIALTNRTRSLSAAKWNLALDDCKENGMQWLILADTTSNTETAIRHIMDYAEANGLKVFMGVLDNKEWQAIHAARGRAGLDEIADEFIANAKKRWGLYSEYKCFYGWYDYPEFYSFPLIVAKDVNYYYKKVSAALNEISPGKKHTISPHPPKIGYSPFWWKKEWSVALKDSGVDIVFWQDGFGARDSGTPADVLPYWRVMYNVCQESDIKLWGNIETFMRIDNAFVPSNVQRLANQFEIALPFCEEFITWEYMYYCNPVYGVEGSGAFNVAYERDFIEKRWFPTYLESIDGS